MAHLHDIPPEVYAPKVSFATTASSKQTEEEDRKNALARGLSLDEAIEHAGCGSFQWATFIFVAIAGYPPTKEMVTLSFLGPALVCKWKLTPEQEASIQLAVFLGALLSSPIMGFLSDVIGRRPVVQATLFLSSVPALLSAFAPSYWTLIGLRFLTGAGAACDPVLFSYFMELLPEAHRGKQVVALTLAWMTSLVFEAGLAWATLTRYGWRFYLLASAIPGLLAWVLSWFMLESPHFLMAHGKVEKAKDEIATIAKLNSVELPRNAMRFDFVPDDEPSSKGGKEGSGDQGCCLSSCITAPFRSMCSTVCGICKPGMAYTTFLIMVFTFSVSFGTITLVEYTVKIYSPQNTANQICTLSGDILYSVYEYEAMIIANLSGMVGVVISFIVIDLMGRKWTLFLLLCCSAAFTMGLLAMVEPTMQNIFISLARTAIHGAYPVVGIYIGELYPTKFRATGEAIAETFNSMAYMLGPFVVDVMYAQGMMLQSVVIMAIVMWVGALATLACPRERKGMSLSMGTIMGNQQADKMQADEEKAAAATQKVSNSGISARP
mmetsp:Transcript_3288/g.9449  ORF Transcript_3288/g.9449 Transcript_3288/m.9449 type:complete len:550 (-) Transcript_3288:1470-3119(-)